MKGIFISYRRQDSQSAAGRLADDIKKNLAGVSVFRDVETIQPGMDFVDVINHALQSCGVLLAVIGPRWISAQDSAGQRRLDNPDDFTRLEIATALKRNDVRVIPVLVEGAQMPEPDDLPEDLRALARRNAHELTDNRWSYDVSRLVATVRQALGVPDPTPKPPGPQWRWPAAAIGALIVAGYMGWQGQTPDVPAVTPPTLPTSTTTNADELLLKLHNANIRNSVGDNTMLEWLRDSDQYRRLAEECLRQVGKKYVAKEGVDLDKVNYYYVESLGVKTDGDIPIDHQIDSQQLLRAIIKAYNNKNGTTINSLREALE